MSKKPFPKMRTDEEAEDFTANSDLTEYDLSELVRVRFELKPKDPLPPEKAVQTPQA